MKINSGAGIERMSKIDTFYTHIHKNEKKCESAGNNSNNNNNNNQRLK